MFMVETTTRESFHDFAQALVDLGADNAIYIVGSSAYHLHVCWNRRASECKANLFALPSEKEEKP